MTTGLSSSLCRLLAAWVAAVLLLGNSASAAETSPHDLVAPSLVYLTVEFTPTKGNISGVPQTDQSTGFLISDDGFILTSYHLLERVSTYGGENVKVAATLATDPPETKTAAIVNGLLPLDVLLLKIRATHALPHLTLGRADVVNVGDHLFTSGFYGENPFDREGTVNNKFGPSSGIGYLWTLNMSVASGQSGSPVCLADGTVVGILKGEDTAALGIGYMVPIELADPLIAHLRFRDLEKLITAHEKEIGWSKADEPIGPRLAKVEKGMQDVSKNFVWDGQEVDGKLILAYHKLVAGAPQIKSVLVAIYPLVTKQDSQETQKDNSTLIKDTKARDVTLSPGERGGGLIIQDVGTVIGYKLKSTGDKISISRVEVSIVATLDDGKETALDPAKIWIDTQRYVNW